MKKGEISCLYYGPPRLMKRWSCRSKKCPGTLKLLKKSKRKFLLPGMLDVIDSLWTDSIHKKKFHVRTRQKFIIFGFFHLTSSSSSAGKPKTKPNSLNFIQFFLFLVTKRVLCVQLFTVHKYTRKRILKTHSVTFRTWYAPCLFYLFFKNSKSLSHWLFSSLSQHLTKKERETSFTGRKPLNY